jgi:phage-related protein
MASPSHPKPLFWMSSTQDDLRAFPQEVRQVMGYALYLAQVGDKHLDAKPLKGFAGAGVLEIVADYDGDAFRAVYTVRFADAIYVLHAFQKKSTRGIATPKREIERIRQRLKQAQAHYEGWRRQPRGDRS